MIAPTSQSRTVPFRVEQRMKDVVRRVFLPTSQVRLYEEHLTDDEKETLFSFHKQDESDANAARERVGKEPVAATPEAGFAGSGHKNICRLAELRNMMPEQLTLDLAYKFGFLSGEPEYNQLIRYYCGEDRRSATERIQYLDGELWLNGELARTVRRGVAKKTNMELILETFQEEGWRRNKVSFDSVLEPEQTLQFAVRDLNKKLKGMRFRSHLRGTEVSWEITN